MEKKIIALTDDDSNIRNALERTILKHFDNVEVKQFSSTLEIKKFLPFIKQTAPSVQVILLSAMEKTYGESVTEVAGDMIFDFMSKPVTETELIVKVRKALRTQENSLNKILSNFSVLLLAMIALKNLILKMVYYLIKNAI